MFSSRKNFSLTLGVLLSTSLLVYACGGGGGGGGGASTTPATSKASSAATKSIVSTVGAVGAGTDAGAAKPAFKGTASGTENDAKLIRKGIENLKARMQGGGNRQKAMMAVTSDSGEVSCGPLGGTERNIIDDSGTLSDASDDKFTTIYTNCRTDEGGGIHKLKNGTVEESFAGGLFSSSFSNSDTTRGFEESEIDTTSGDRVIKFESTKGTLVMSSGSFVDCGTESFVQNAALTMNMTVEEKEDEDATVGFEKDELFTANNFTMTITDNFNPSPDCTWISEVIVLNGGTSFEDKLNSASDDNYSAAFTDFTVTIADREDVNGAFLGEEIVLSGSVTITSPCANGTYTVATTTPLFFPDGAACPVEGRMDISGGGSTSAVIVNSNGSVDFDDNGDGNVDDDNDGVIEPGEGKHFDSCDDSDICSA